MWTERHRSSLRPRGQAFSGCHGEGDSNTAHSSAQPWALAAAVSPRQSVCVLWRVGQRGLSTKQVFRVSRLRVSKSCTLFPAALPPRRPGAFLCIWRLFISDAVTVEITSRADSSKAWFGGQASPGRARVEVRPPRVATRPGQVQASTVVPFREPPCCGPTQEVPSCCRA